MPLQGESVGADVAARARSPSSASGSRSWSRSASGRRPWPRWRGRTPPRGAIARIVSPPRRDRSPPLRRGAAQPDAVLGPGERDGRLGQAWPVERRHEPHVQPRRVHPRPIGDHDGGVFHAGVKRSVGLTEHVDIQRAHPAVVHDDRADTRPIRGSGDCHGAPFPEAPVNARAYLRARLVQVAGQGNFEHTAFRVR